MNKNQKNLFLAMREEMQNILNQYPRLLDIQAWAVKKANQNLPYKKIAVRALYWYLAIILARVNNPEPNEQKDRTCKLASDFARALTPHRALALNPTLNPENLRALARGNLTHLAPAKSMARNLSINPDLSKKHFEDLDHALDLSRAFVVDHAIALGQISPLPAREEPNFFSFDFDTSNLIALATIFSLMPSEKRSKENIKKLQTILTDWEQESINNNSLLPTKETTCPSYNASEHEWQQFKDIINETGGKALRIDIRTAWSLDEFEAIQTYLRSTQFFLECLQEANIENNEAFEAMILNVPEG